MKNTTILLIFLSISLIALLSACGGGGGDDEETEEILDIFENTEWYFYDNDAIDTYNSIRVLYNRKVYIPFSYLSSNYIFTVVGNREVHYDLEPWSGPELHFKIDGLVVNNYVTTISGKLTRNRYDAEHHLATPDYAYIYAGLGIDAENAETYTWITQNCVKKGGHFSNPFIGTSWDAGGGDTFYFRDDKICLVSGVEYEYQLTMVPTEDDQSILFLIRNKDYGASGYSWNGFQYIPVDSFSIKGKYSDFNNLLQITEEITANIYNRN